MSKYNYKWHLKDADFTKNKGKVFSCFAGGGGSSMGYKLAGFDVIGCLEIDKKMIAVYEANLSPKYAFCEAIQDFKLRKDLPKELYKLDILDGSPPCSSFSLAGNREKDWGKERVFREGQKSQVLDTLFFDFIDLAKELQPKIVIAENVKGIILGNAKKYIERIYNEFNVAGYYLQHHLLDCSKMGVPQKRERVFFIAVRKDLAKKHLILAEKDMFTKIPYINLHFNQKKIAFENIMNGEPGHSNRTLEMIWDSCEIGKNPTGFGKDGKSFFSYIKCDPKKVLPTILGGGNSKAAYLMHPYIPRYLNNLEVIQGQSFPLDYNSVGGYVHYVCGMSVPPVAMANLVDRIYNQWNEIFDCKNNS